MTRTPNAPDPSDPSDPSGTSGTSGTSGASGPRTWLTVGEVAKRLELHVATVYLLVKQRRIAHTRVGCGRKAGRIRIRPADVEEYERRNRVDRALDA